MALEIEALDVLVFAAGGAAEVARDIRCGLRTDVRLRLSGSPKAWQALKTRRVGLLTVQCLIQW